MTDITVNPGDHVAIVRPDDRYRIALKAWLTREPVDGYRVFRLNGGKTIVLQAVEP